MPKKKISLKEKIRRQKQSEESGGVSYKEGVKFIKLKGQDGYKVEFLEEGDE
jgi:hypothetical protein